MKSGCKGQGNDKEVHLSSIDGDGLIKGKCRTCRKGAQLQGQEMQETQRGLAQCHTNGKMRGIQTMAAQTKRAISVA